jgi:hypothetical protein
VSQARPWVGTAGLVLLGYTLWLVEAALAGLVVVALREALRRLTVAFGWGPYALIGLDKFGVFVFVLIWLGWVVFAEGALRRAMGQGLRPLAATFWRTTWPVLLLLAVLGAPVALLRQ